MHLLRNIPFDVFRFVWSMVISKQQLIVALAVFLGLCIRALTILGFVLTIQAIVMAALHRNGMFSALFQDALNGALSIRMDINPALFAAVVIVAIYAILLCLHIIYQHLAGRCIAGAFERLIERHSLTQAQMTDARRIITIAATNSIRALEIALFLLVSYIFICFISIPLAGALLFGTLTPIVVLVWYGKSALQRNHRLGATKRALVTNRVEDDMVTRLNDFIMLDESNRFSRGIYIGVEGLVIGLFTAAIIVAIVLLTIDLSAFATISIFIVFGMRYAIVYARDLSRSINALFSLRRSEAILLMRKAKGVDFQ